MKKFIFILTILILTTQTTFAIQDTHCNCATHKHETAEIKANSVLTIRDCISIGIENSPIIKEYLHRLELATSNVGKAKANYFPELSAGIGYGQSLNSNDTDFNSNYREIPTISVAIKKMIWDFGKTTANIKMEEFLKIAAEYEFEDSVCSSVFDIKTKYYSLLKAQAIYKAEQTNYLTQEKIISEIKPLVKSNTKNKADLVNAELELIAIKMDLLLAEDNFKNAKENLNNAMFLKNAPNYTIYETQTFQYLPQSPYKNISNLKKVKIAKDDTIFQHPKFTNSEAVNIAYKNSPDIKALESIEKAMEQALISIKKNYYPELNGGIGYDFLNSNEYTNNGLNIAVNLSSSINAMRQKYDVKGATSELNLAQNEIIKFKDNLYFRVRKCLNTLDIANKELPIANYRLTKAVENFKLIENNYLNNTMNQLELQNARISYYNALKSSINAQYEYNIALINLEMSMHMHLIDYHDEAEHAVEFHEGKETDTLSKLIKCKEKHTH